MADLDAAISHHQAGRFDAAETIYRDILRSAPEDVDALHLLGLVAVEKGEAEHAVDLIRKAIALKPGVALFHNSLGNGLKAKGDHDDALASFHQALALDPRLVGAHVNLADTLKLQGNLSAAIDSYRRAIELDPDFPPALIGLGGGHQMEGRLLDAEQHLRHAVKVAPELPRAHDTLGFLLQQLCRYGEARACFDRALALDPDHPSARTNLAVLLLVLGDFANAWPLYTARLPAKSRPRNLWQDPLPPDLAGKHLLVSKNQGLGDEIFFLRFAPELFRRGARITYVTDPRLVPILAPLDFLDEVVAEGKDPPKADYILSCGDLPLACGMTTSAQIPPPYPLPVQGQLRDKFARKLKDLGAAPYIGVTWRAGTPRQTGSAFKQAPLDRFAEVLRPVNGTLLALQRQPDAGEIDALAERIGRPVHDFTALNDDLEDMLALLSLIDDYVTVSNTNVHFRAGTGKTCHVLVPNPQEWRWMAEGDESPWFPGTGVYRQGHDQSWDEAFSRLGQDLMEALGSREESH